MSNLNIEILIKNALQELLKLNKEISAKENECVYTICGDINNLILTTDEPSYDNGPLEAVLLYLRNIECINNACIQKITIIPPIIQGEFNIYLYKKSDACKLYHLIFRTEKYAIENGNFVFTEPLSFIIQDTDAKEK